MNKVNHMKKTYHVYLRTIDGASIVAVIKGTQIKGPWAKRIRHALLEGRSDTGTWPDIAPDYILCGDYLWAAEVPDTSKPK